MPQVDIKTVMLVFAVNNVIGCAVMAVLWSQNRKRTPVVGYWLASNLFQLLGSLLISLRGVIPESVSIVLATMFLLVSFHLSLVGFERYAGKPSSRAKDIAVLCALFAGSAFFTYAWGNISLRNVNYSLGVVYYFSLIAWLSFVRAKGEWRSILRPVGIVSLAIVLVNAVRAAKNLAYPVRAGLFSLGPVDQSVIVASGFLSLVLNFTIVLMVSRRLLTDLERDLVEKTRVSDELWRAKERFAGAFMTSPNSIVLSTLREGIIVEVNDAFVRNTGFSREEAIGKTSVEIGLWVDASEREEIVAALLRGESIVARETRIRRKDGSIMFCLFSSKRITLEQGECIISTIQNVTERKRAEETILHMATHDSLTDLPTMNLARDRLEMAMAQARRTGCVMAVLFVDVDRFKEINDTRGHDAGDRALKAIASRIAARVRESDTVARIGGDEFLVILSNLKSREDSRVVAAKIIEAFSSPVELDAENVSVTVSVGIACFGDDGTTADTLIKAADVAMYRVKREGKNWYRFAGDK